MSELKLDHSENRSSTCWLFSIMSIGTVMVIGLGLLAYSTNNKSDLDIIILSVLFIIGFLFILVSFISLVNKKDEDVKLHLGAPKYNTNNFNKLKMETMDLRTKALDKRILIGRKLYETKKEESSRFKIKNKSEYINFNLNYDRLHELRLGGLS